jgi:murein DD-endopeptidase MepM/ murein hydrolase activator NlpD
MFKQSLIGLVVLSQLCAALPPAKAQIISSDQGQSIGSGTWEQTPGGGDALVQNPPPGAPQYGLSYNVWRAVPANASLGRTIKVGDLSNTRLPDGSQYFGDRNRSMAEMLQLQGKSAEDVKVGDFSYTSGLTLGEVVEANHGQLPKGLETKLRQGGGSGFGLTQVGQFGGAGGDLVKALDQNPALQEIPLSELASGNFGGALDIGVQRGAAEALKSLPANWRDLPVGAIAGSLASGDYKAALKEGLSYGGQKFSEYILKSDALKNLPVGAIAKDLPISELGNITSAPLSTLPRIGSQYISKIPGIKDGSVVQSGVSAAITLARGDLAVKLDVAYAGKKEQPSANAFTGGTPKNVFGATDCVINSAKKGRGKTNNCAHFEMGEMNIGTKCKYNKATLIDNLLSKCRYKGKQMVDGQNQQVKGGKGILAKVNGGWEPTGWKPFSDADGYNPAKLSLKNIKEHPGGNKIAEADIQIDLQICAKFWGETHCTPHFIPVPTPFKAKQNSLLLLMASGSPPKEVQDAINSISSRPEYCDAVDQANGSTPAKPTLVASGSGSLPSTGTGNTAQKNTKQYLARIAAGETSGGSNIGSYPSPGSNAPYGEYQFRGSTRESVLASYPGLDAWSSDKATRDKAALAWIGLYGREVGVDILGQIQSGDFTSADKALGKNQFTSLPGGSEASPIWSNPKTLAEYGAGGTAPIGNRSSATAGNCASASGGGSSPGSYSGPTSGALAKPVNGPETSDFGPRESPCAGCSSNHMGQDYGVPDGTPVAAAANGKIVYQGWISGYGNTVFIDHGNGTMTQYSHLGGYIGATGSTVMQGATIATSGHSGVGTGAHLHFGVLTGTTGGNFHTGNYVDPLTMLKR